MSSRFPDLTYRKPSQIRPGMWVREQHGGWRPVICAVHLPSGTWSLRFAGADGVLVKPGELLESRRTAPEQQRRRYTGAEFVLRLWEVNRSHSFLIEESDGGGSSDGQARRGKPRSRMCRPRVEAPPGLAPVQSHRPRYSAASR